MSIHAFLLFLQEQAAGSSAPTTQGATGEAPAAQAPWWAGWIMPVALLAIFYFVMIVPERKARKKREAMLTAMKKGDRVMTSGGMYATIAAINGDEITLQIDDGVRARFSRQAITQVLEDAATAEAKK